MTLVHRWGAALAACVMVAPALAQSPAVVLEVQAPDALRTLLEQHLDLARLQRLGDGATLDDSEWARLAAAAPAQARELLQTEGYFSPQVSVQRTPGRPQRVRLQVEPGTRTTVGRIDIVAEGELDRRATADAPTRDEADARALLAALRTDWPLPPGSAFRNEAWSQAKSQLLARLRAAGYASATFSGTTADVDAEQARVRLYLVADSGPLYRAGEVVINGLTAHAADAVRHQAGFTAGAPLTEARLLDYQERLVKLGLFDSASVSFEPDPATAAATTVHVRVRELPLRQLTLGVGVSANTGPRVSAEFTHRRPFDRAAIAHNKLEWGRDRRVWEGELSSLPNARFQRNLVGVQYEYLVGDTDTVTTQRLRLGRSLDTPRLERLVFAEYDRSEQLAANDFHRDASALTANLQVIWRELDSVLLPTRGWSLSLQGGAGHARSPDAPAGAFARLYGRATGYWPLGQSWYGQARVEVGQILKRDAVRVPDTLAFRAGGDESVRGYAWRSLAPTISGVTVAAPALATMSLEIARPISARLPSVWGAAFIDAGRAVDRWADYKPALGYGVGVRWRSPVGPLKLDWAWGEELKKGRLHMSVGIAF